jgi:hypothetical protein
MTNIRDYIEQRLDLLERGQQSSTIAFVDHIRDVMDSLSEEETDELIPAAIAECDEMILICQRLRADLGAIPPTKKGA